MFVGRYLGYDKPAIGFDIKTVTLLALILQKLSCPRLGVKGQKFDDSGPCSGPVYAYVSNARLIARRSERLEPIFPQPFELAARPFVAQRGKAHTVLSQPAG